MEIGLACTVCGQLNLIRAQTCSRCGNVLAPAPVNVPSAAPPVSLAPSSPAAVTNAGPQTSKRPPPLANASPDPAPRFDPSTGQPLVRADTKPAAKTMFFGALQQETVTPRLVVIKGEGGDGTTFHLSGTTHVVGRGSGDISFPEDVFLNLEHAKFSVQDGRLFVQDLDSTNGVFVRIRRPVSLDHQDCFLVGEQLLCLDSEPLPEQTPSQNGTHCYSSPRNDHSFRVVQLLAGGGEGRMVASAGHAMTIGRENNVFNFPKDRFISGHHVRLEVAPDQRQILLTDTGSRNGTFVRIKGAQELHHGDYLFVGQQLFRVEFP